MYLIKNYPEHQNQLSILTQILLLCVGFPVSIFLILIKMSVVQR